MPHYANVVVVAKSGGDFIDPIAAIDSITDASATNPYLLKIMPGVYDCQSGTWGTAVPDYVDIEGSGKNTTVIKFQSYASVGGFYYSYARHVELRDLTIEVSVTNPEWNGKHARGVIFAGDGTNFDASPGPHISNAFIKASGGETNIGVTAGVYSNHILTGVEIIADTPLTATGSLSAAVYVEGSTFNIGWTNLTMNRVTARSQGGDYENCGLKAVLWAKTVITDSDIIGATSGLCIGQSPNYSQFHVTLATYNSRVSGGVNAATIAPGDALKAAGTQFSGSIQNSGTFVSTSCFDADFAPLP